MMKPVFPLLLAFLTAFSCSKPAAIVRLNVIDPGHFHAALVQKEALPGVCDTVRVYAPEGEELQQYLATVASYGQHRIQEIHSGENFLSLLPPAQGTEAVVLAGNNARKTAYLLQAAQSGYHMLADKPMAITRADYHLLEQACESAREQGLVLLELMTERYDRVNLRIRELLPEMGQICSGSPEEPAIVMESVHHFYKEVSGRPLVRPQWYYDTRCQGEGIADVTTHLVDLVFWQCFPGESITPSDISLVCATHYPTLISPEQFRRSTGAEAFPPELTPDPEGYLPVYANGSITFCVKGVYVRMDVRWDFEGEPDAFHAVYHCADGDIAIVQDEHTAYARKLYAGGADCTPESGPGHEEHFSLVTQAFLRYVRGEETLPDWEWSNLLAKYDLLTEAVTQAR